MEQPNPQDHDIYWEDNPTMRDRTKEYQKWALEVVNHSESKLFTPIVKHPWSDRGIDWSTKVTIVEFEGDHIQDPRQYDNIRDMILDWENTPKDRPTTRNRRIILLQDVNPRMIEHLGVNLNIPPHFFLAHCDELSGLRVIDGTYAAQKDSMYWKVPVSQTRSVPSGVKPGRYTIEAGDWYRKEVDINESVEFVNFRSLVSCWGRSYGSDSWTEVLVTDDGTPRDTIQPLRRNIVEATVEAYNLNTTPHTEDPFTGTIFVRNLIRSAWEGSILRSARDIRDQLYNDREQFEEHQRVAFDPSKTRSDKPYRDASAGVAYFGLMTTRQCIQDAKGQIESIMWKFRCRDVKDISQAHGQLSGAFQARNSQLQDYLSREKRSWMMLHETLCRMESNVADHMEMWSQRAALEQAAAANRAARTSGQLTKIATIIVPCTFVASIFSMGGQFAVGEDCFFVYWIASVPVIIVLAWVLHHVYNDSARMCERNARRPKLEESSSSCWRTSIKLLQILR